MYATIEFCWDDALRQLTIGKRQGEFPGMLKQRSFRVVLVKEGQGTGMDLTRKPDRVIPYDGNQAVVKF